MKNCPGIKVLLLFWFLYGGYTATIWGKETENGEDDGLSFIALPFITYSTDTGFGAGAAAVKGYNKDRVRVSTAKVSFLYTVKKQFTAGFTVNHYFPGNRDMVFSECYYSKYPTYFYGYGNDASNDDPEKYTPEYFKFEFMYEHRLKRYFRLRGGFFLHNQALVKSDPEGILTSTGIPWYGGRFDAGPEFSLVHDSRDNIIAARRGTLLQAVYRSGMFNDEGGAFNSVTLEGRTFYNPVSELVFAFMARVEDARGDIPFYLVPVLGGEDRLRGYEFERFRDRNSILFQQDIRFPVWRTFSGAVFAATGRVAPDVETLFTGTYHSAAGCGVRWYFNKEDNLMARFDLAWGSDTYGAYIGFGEAF
ncbi:hypothetical protein LLG96_05950 [bacterium]|nr:hypothetical protein [bacterium]